MHEIRANILPEHVSEAVLLANNAGIAEATTCEVFLHGPNVKRVLLSIETSTPKAQAFTEALLASRISAESEFALTSREVRAVVGRESGACQQ